MSENALHRKGGTRPPAPFILIPDSISRSDENSFNDKISKTIGESEDTVARDMPHEARGISQERMLLKRNLENLSLTENHASVGEGLRILPLVPYAESSIWASDESEISSYLTDEQNGFSLLPNDLIQKVFDLLRSKKEQRSLLLASKRVYQVIHPLFYHTITINLNDSNVMERVKALISKQNAGLPYIKHIKCILTSPASSLSNDGKFEAFKVALALASGLQQNQLDHFEWPNDVPLPPKYTLHLWQRQKNLQNLEFWNNTWLQPVQPYMERLHGMISQALSQMNFVQELRIIAENTNGFEAYAALKEKDIKSLHVDVKNLVIHSKIDDHCQVIVERLFRHLAPFDKLVTAHHKFTRLVLTCVDMFLCEETWLKVMDVASLRDVELRQCPFSDQFLNGLTRANAELEKLTLHFKFETDMERGMDLDTVSSLEKLLRKMPQGRMKKLHLFLSGHRNLLDAKVIGRHSGSLEELRLQIWDVQIRDDIALDMSPVLQLLEIEDILKGATPQLTKLALLFNFSEDISDNVAMLLKHLHDCIQVISAFCAPSVLYISGFAGLLQASKEPNDLRAYAESCSILSHNLDMLLTDFVRKFFASKSRLGPRLDEVWPFHKLGPKCRVLGLGGGASDTLGKYYAQDGEAVKTLSLEKLRAMEEDVGFLTPIG